MTSSEPDRLRIVVGEPGLARALRDAGHEVIYTGPDQSPEQIVATAIQEDADVIGLSARSDGEPALAADLAALLARHGVDDIAVKLLSSRP
ncbi:cobalamin-dependent protein [Nocardioides sp.]|uniref:cobalamin B12-binding domain-containing protein n=1 Tax=Nocardioides sp. TaxID=35761 RepID=UPI00286E27DE|nr:cobalamin-dependent protein [Nocardioides sp.]